MFCNCLALVGEAGVARDDEEARKPRKVAYQLVGDAITEVLLVGIAALIGKRQYRDGGDARQRQRGLFLRRNRGLSPRRPERHMLYQHDCPNHDCSNDDRKPDQRQHAAAPVPAWYPTCCPRRCGPIQQHAPHVHRMRDVLDRLFAEVLVAERELVPNLFVNGPRDADAAGVGETFQPRRDIDSVAVDLVAFDHHIAEVDADAEVHPARRRQPGVLNLERALNIHRAIDRIDHAGELGKYAIAGRIYEAPVALLDETIDDLAMSGQGEQGSPPHLRP